MNKRSNRETPEPKIAGPVKIEWNWDMDERSHVMKGITVGGRKYEMGEEGRISVKGRCKRCWGGLIAKCGDGSLPEAIRCRVCGITLEGDDAKEEFNRMSNESRSNTFNMVFGQPLKYSAEGTFVDKLFPYMDRVPEDEFRQRVDDRATEGNEERWLTRSGFPAGSAGFLFLQARVLMSGMERLPRELSVAPFSEFDIHADGSATVYLSKEELTEHSKTREHKLLRSLGSTLTVAMMSAFACELLMKAIRLTRIDKARKSHDLWKLYKDLPQDSKDRVRADFPEIESVLKSARYTFDKWRYFEANVGGHGIAAMGDTARALDLAKTARVLIDEAEMMGLGYSVRVTATQRVRQFDQRKDIHVTHDIYTQGTEAPPR